MKTKLIFITAFIFALTINVFTQVNITPIELLTNEPAQTCRITKNLLR